MLKEVSYKKLVAETEYPIMVIKDGRIISLDELFAGVSVLIDVPAPAQPKPMPEQEKKEPKKRRSGKELEREIIKAYNNGERTISQIMDIVGCTYATVRRYIPISKEG